MELAELVAGATIKRRLRSKQTVTVCLDHQIQQQRQSHMWKSIRLCQTGQNRQKWKSIRFVPERTEPWRPLTETEKNAWNALCLKSEKCATPWSTGCIENLGIQTSGAWWTACVKIVLIQRCWQAAKLMHCTACQESARMLSRPVTSGKVMEPGAERKIWKAVPARSDIC